MKKTIFAIALSLATVAAGAQTMYDGLNISQNNYYGTARSIGMGNAMTAVGGDLGSIGINPAGSSVYNYSQFAITPNVTISSMKSSFSAYPENGNDMFRNEQSTSFARFMPNFGATFNMNTGNRSGIKSYTFGILVNSTNNFSTKMMGWGKNDKTSYLSAMAIGAEGFDFNFLNGDGELNNNNEYKKFDERIWDNAYFKPDRGLYAPWNVIVNAQSGAIANFGNADDPDYYQRYIAATEGYTMTDEIDEKGNHVYKIFLGGPLNQAYGRNVTGGKHDMLLNFGMNVNDRFYLGANLGVTTLNYDFDEYFKEAAVDPADFAIDFGETGKTSFQSYRARYSYSTNGSGVYAKLGFIAKPTDNLRIGAAAQTPTMMKISEVWRHASDVYYVDAKFNGNAFSPEGNFSYSLRTPYRLNAGAAYTIMGMAMLSADYEMTDFSTIKYKSDFSNDSTFDGVNNDIKGGLGVSHAVRLGAEFKPMPEFAIRAGYNYTLTPINDAKTKIKDKMNAYTVGVGYSSSGSFFADFSARLLTMADEWVSPYKDYLTDCPSPLILNKRERYDITATIGWRF